MTVPLDDQWQSYGQEVEASLTRIEDEIATLRDILRRGGIEVRRQRTRIGPGNAKRAEALSLLAKWQHVTMTPSLVSFALGISPEYAFDLLASLVASGDAQRVTRGRYQYIPNPPKRGAHTHP